MASGGGGDRASRGTTCCPVRAAYLAFAAAVAVIP